MGPLMASEQGAHSKLNEADGGVSNIRAGKFGFRNQKAGFMDKREKRVSSENSGKFEKTLPAGNHSETRFQHKYGIII